MEIPRLQIRQTPARLSISQDHGGVDIQQPRPQVDIQTTPLRIEIEREDSQLIIDQSKAWAAYGNMNPIEMNTRINSQVTRNVHQYIARVVEDGNRMKATHHSTNVIAELAAERKIVEFPEFQYADEASYDNVEIQYTPSKVNLNPIAGTVDIQVEPQKPMIERVPAKVHIDVQSYGSVQIQVGHHIDITK